MTTTTLTTTTRRELFWKIGGAALAHRFAGVISGAAGRGAFAGVAPNRHSQLEFLEMPEKERLDWFLDAKFGLFLHWGPYSVAGVEASWPIMEPGLLKPLGAGQQISESDYVALARRFDPRSFNPRQWARIARHAGMRYVVITAKHHDGFCLFDAPGTTYKITNTPFGRDVCGELAEACAAEGLRLGFYYSPPDMFDPAYRDTSRPARENWWGEPETPRWSEYLDHMEAHLRKLLRSYGDVAIVWFDGLFEHEKYDPPRFHRLIRELSPSTLVNDRLGAGLGDYVTPEQTGLAGIPVKRAPGEVAPPDVTLAQFRQFVAAVERGLSPEQYAAIFAAAQKMRFPTELLPPVERFQPWETCLTMGRTWAYDPSESEYKSAPALIATLVEIASRGGNLLLNVGPTPEGALPAPCVERLERIGSWMEHHGEAVHATTFGPVQGDAAIRTLRPRASGDRRVFVAVMAEAADALAAGARSEPSGGGAPAGGTTVVAVPDFGQEIERARMLGNAAENAAVGVERSGETWSLRLQPPLPEPPSVETAIIELSLRP